MAHVLPGFHDKRVVVGADAVRAVVKTSKDAVGTDGGKGAIITVTVYTVHKLKHGQMTAQRSQVFRTEEKATKELAFHTQVEILA